ARAKLAGVPKITGESRRDRPSRTAWDAPFWRNRDVQGHRSDSHVSTHPNHVKELTEEQRQHAGGASRCKAADRLGPRPAVTDAAQGGRAGDDVRLGLGTAPRRGWGAQVAACGLAR